MRLILNALACLDYGCDCKGNENGKNGYFRTSEAIPNINGLSIVQGELFGVRLEQLFSIDLKGGDSFLAFC